MYLDRDGYGLFFGKLENVFYLDKCFQILNN